jgi:hypothetical protein
MVYIVEVTILFLFNQQQISLLGFFLLFTVWEGYHYFPTVYKKLLDPFEKVNFYICISLRTCKQHFKNLTEAEHQWLMPLILPT